MHRIRSGYTVGVSQTDTSIIKQLMSFIAGRLISGCRGFQHQLYKAIILSWSLCVVDRAVSGVCTEHNYTVLLHLVHTTDQ